MKFVIGFIAEHNHCNSEKTAQSQCQLQNYGITSQRNSL